MIARSLMPLLRWLVLEKIDHPPAPRAEPPARRRRRKHVLDGADLSVACGCGRDYLQVPIDEQCCPEPRPSRGYVVW